MKMHSQLLINEPPLQVLPSLACKIGLNQALFLQQLHYWLNQPAIGIEQHGRKWIYNSVQEWNSNFPFWSDSTIKRIISNLEDMKLIVSAQLAENTWDHTKYYAIDYQALDRLCQNDTIDEVKMTQSMGSKWNDREGQDDTISLTETTTKTTIEGVKPSKSDTEQNIDSADPESYFSIPREKRMQQLRDKMSAQQTIIQQRGYDINEYPADCHNVIDAIYDLWRIRPPSKKIKKQYSYWVEGCRGLNDAIGEFDVHEVLKKYYAQYQKSIEDNDGTPPFLVNSPSSLVKSIRGFTATMRTHPESRNINIVGEILE